ncbi:MAG: WhiB family transcriptional regulator [Acidimicrobiales bacterium]
MTSATLVVTAPGWRNQALCAHVACDLFFAENAVARAKAVCALCPVWAECLAFGLHEGHGIWGGLTRSERARLRRLRSRLTDAPADPQNSEDLRRLALHSLWNVERLETALGFLEQERVPR